MLVGLQNVYAQQQDHFVYIQSDDKVAFDVTVNGTTYKSSPIGYVIIPKLIKGNYQFNISFPNKKFPDQVFAFTIDKVDAGFALKNYDEKGWGLYNLQTMDIMMAGGKSVTDAEAVATPPVDNAFGNMLSEVVDDSTLNKKITLEKEVQETKAAAATVTETTPVVEAPNTTKSVEVAKVDVDNNQAQTAGKQKIKSLTKVNEYLSDAGRDVIFVDNTGGFNDTIRIFLPKTNIAENEIVANSSINEVAKTTAKDTVTKETVKETTDTLKTTIVEKPGDVTNPFFNKEAESKTIEEAKEQVSTSVKENEAVINTASAVSKPFCPNAIDESEVDKLKKKIVSASSEDKMLAAVRKAIQDKCITTTQVKSLGALFLSDDSRFNFFNTIYTSVSDTQNLVSLESQLIDATYKKRYKALLN